MTRKRLSEAAKTIRSASQARKIAAKRRADPVREARRQANLTRMLHRFVYIPSYEPTPSGFRYTGHVKHVLKSSMEAAY